MNWVLKKSTNDNFGMKMWRICVSEISCEELNSYQIQNKFRKCEYFSIGVCYGVERCSVNWILCHFVIRKS